MAEFKFDSEAADGACLFFERYLTHVEGKQWTKPNGDPLPFVLDDWQKEKIIRPLFGWKRADGTRRYRTAYIEIPRKNGKSTLCAGIALLLLFADHEQGGKVFSAASDREQAALVFNVASQMVKNSPALRKRAKIRHRSIVVPKTFSAYQVLSAEAFTKHGLNAHGIIFDELHAQPNRDLWDVLTTSTGARTQPLIVAITTAGFDEESICYEVRTHAIKVRDGIIDDPSFLTVIYAAEKDDDWKDEAVWAKANPGLGKSVRIENLRDEVQLAIESPLEQNKFKRLHLNIWTQQSVLWLDMDKWDACSTPVDEKALEGKEAFGGLDMATTTDLTAFDLEFPREDGGFDGITRFWIPEDTAKLRERRDRVPYSKWIDMGLIRTTPGNVCDYSVVRRDILEDCRRFNVREIAFDPWNATQLAIDLQSDGIQMFQFRQGYASMNEPTKALEKLMLDKKIAHGGNPVLRWQASNVSVKTDPSGNIKPEKPKHGTSKRIDGIVAKIMALGRALMKPDELLDIRVI